MATALLVTEKTSTIKEFSYDIHEYAESYEPIKLVTTTVTKQDIIKLETRNNL